MIAATPAKRKANILHLVKPKRMTEELKILDSKTCGNAWIGVTGTLYHIQVGADAQNPRVAFQQFDSNKCAWVKKGQEDEAWKLVDSDPADNLALFDKNEPQEALTTFLMQTKPPCSHPDKLPHTAREKALRKVCG